MDNIEHIAIVFDNYMIKNCHGVANAKSQQDLAHVMKTDVRGIRELCNYIATSKDKRFEGSFPCGDNNGVYYASNASELTTYVARLRETAKSLAIRYNMMARKGKRVFGSGYSQLTLDLDD
jgi:hypothetical protein